MGPNAVALLGRILLSAIFIWAGYAKAVDYTKTIGMMQHFNVPLPRISFIVPIAVELLGGIAILVGFRTRLAAAILAAWCIFTAMLAHYHPGDTNQMINFMKNVAMAGGFLQLVAWGGGRFSIDRR